MARDIDFWGGKEFLLFFFFFFFKPRTDNQAAREKIGARTRRRDDRF